MVNVSAAENADGSSSFVEDTNISTWTVSPSLNSSGSVNYVNGIYCFRTIGLHSTGSTTFVHIYNRFDETSVKSNSNYTVKFKFPSYSVFKKYYNPNFDEKWYIDQFAADSSEFIGLSIGLGYLDENGDFIHYDDYTYTFTQDDIISSFDSEFTWSFTLKNFKGKTPYFGITVMTNSPYANHYFYFYQPEFIDESKAEEDGFFARLFQWFQEKFDNLKSWFSDLGDSIGGFFSALGDKISGLFNSLSEWISDLKETITAKLEAIVDDIKGLFIPDEQFVSTWRSDMESLLADHLGVVYDVADFFIDFIRKIFNLLSHSSDFELNFVLPKLEFEIGGETYVIWNDTAVDMSFLNSGIFKVMYTMYKVILYMILAFLLFNHAKNVGRRTMNN